ERDCRSEIAGNLAEMRQNRFRKVLEIFWQLLVAGAGGPASQDGSECARRGIAGLRSSGGVVTDDDVPRADFPFFGEAVEDVGIFAGEVFDFGFVVDVKNEESAVDGFAKRSAHHELAAFAGFTR